MSYIGVYTLFVQEPIRRVMGVFCEEIEISRLTRVEKYLLTRTLRETEIDYYYWESLLDEVRVITEIIIYTLFNRVTHEQTVIKP